MIGYNFEYCSYVVLISQPTVLIILLRSRSRSPGNRSGNYGTHLGVLPVESSPIDPEQKVPKLFNTVIIIDYFGNLIQWKSRILP